MVDTHTRRFLPQVGPWTQNANITAHGDLYATWHLHGFASELAAASALKGLRAGLNQLAINIGAPDTEWWIHTTRRRLPRMTDLPPCGGWFAQRFDAAYRECMAAEANLFANDLWFTVLLPAPKGLAAGLKGTFAAARRLLTRGHGKPAVPGPEAAFLQAFDDLTAKVHQGLRMYSPTRLGLVPGAKDGVWFNQLDEAFHLILNNTLRRLPVSLGRCGRNIDPCEVEYGHRDWSVNTGSETRTLGTIYSFMNYPAAESPVMFDELLSAPFPFTMTNSARFLRSSKTLEWLSTHTKQMISGNDVAKTQQQQLTKAQDSLQSRNNVWLSHGWSLAVFSDRDLRDLDRNAVAAETIIGNAGVNPVREDKGAKAARMAQLPGNLRWRTRPQKIPSDNFASLAAMNNVPKGRMKGRWGPPLLILRTHADTEYPLHFQVQGSAQIPKEDLGNTFVAGPSGSGKTGLVGSMALTASRQGARVVVVDKDCGLAPMVLAAGGSYLALPNGEPTGLAPLHCLTNSPPDLDYLGKLIRMLIMSDGRGEIDPDEDDRLSRAIERQMQLPAAMRELAGVAVALGQAKENGARARLRKWCRGQRLGWVLDNYADLLDTSGRIWGYDTTALLKNDDVVGPVLSYIFYRTRKLIDGTPIVLAIDEMWHVAQNETFEADNNDQLATIRKNEGVVLMSTQNPQTVLNMRNAHTYLQQIPTKIFFSDQDASAKALIDGFKLTTAEFEAVTSKLSTMKHAFLLKRPGGSTICRFDLGRRPDQIAVISGRRATYELALELRRKYGEEPQLWVPHFERLAPGLVDDPLLQRKDKAA
jgi:type IV secretion system protein VirB4